MEAQASGFHDGTGMSKEEPWLICSYEQLALMAIVLDAHYALGDNIDASPQRRHAPQPHLEILLMNLKAVLDGGDFSISKLTVRLSGAGNQYGGLFGVIGSGGEVHNLGLKEVSIEVTSTTDRDDVYVGGLAGENRGGAIYNSYVSGAVSGTTSIISFLRYGRVGGLVGQNHSNSRIRNSYSTVVPLRGESTTLYIGGLVGENYSSSSGTAKIENTYAAGELSVANDSEINMGGIIGKNTKHRWLLKRGAPQFLCLYSLGLLYWPMWSV